MIFKQLHLEIISHVLARGNWEGGVKIFHYPQGLIRVEK